MSRRAFHTDAPLQGLLVEHPLMLARQLEATAHDAPDGQVLGAVEAAAVPAARERPRKAVEAALQQVASHLPGATGVLDIYHALEQLCAAARARFGEGAAETASWVEEDWGRLQRVLRS